MKDIADALKDAPQETKHKFWWYIITTPIDIFFMFASFYYLINAQFLLFSIPVFIFYVIKIFAYFMVVHAQFEIEKGKRKMKL